MTELEEAGFRRTLSESELPEKGFVTCQVGDLGILLCQVKGEVHAVENRCSHAFTTFDEGRLRGVRLMCPLHGASFDVRDGACLGLPATQPIQSFAVRVVDGEVWVQLP